MTDNKQVLVTGAAGFIGSHLCRKLLDSGANVTGIDSFVSGNAANVYRLMENPAFSMVKHDITVPYFTEADQIYNCASLTHISHHLNSPVQVIKTNLIGSINMLGLARHTKATILQASTGKIYGNTTITSLNETFPGSVNTMGNTSPFIESKRMVETIFSAYNKEYNIDTRIARVFNTYGPGMAPDMEKLIPSIITSALRNKEIHIHGNGSQERWICYVDDMIEAMMALMNSPRGQYTMPMNLGSDIPVSVKNLVDLIISLSGSRSKVKFLDLPGESLMQRHPDISFARQALQWEPSTSLEEGLSNTIEYFDKMLKREDRHFAYMSWIEM